MKRWASLDAAHRYYALEGFVVGRMTCKRCRKSIESAHPPGTDTKRLECKFCGAQDSLFIPWP